MAAMRGDVIRLVSRLDVLSALDVAGRIEIAGIQGAESVVVLFDRIRAQLADASSRITALRDAVLVREAGVDTRVLLGAADHAARQVAALAA